jgi:hypothetical protein
VPGSLCYNFTSAASGVHPASNFQSTSSVSSFAQNINVQASAKLAFGQFSANNQFAYSDSAASEQRSGSVYFNASSLFTLTNTVQNRTPLNGTGQIALDSGTFAASCGSEYLETLTGGMLAAGRLQWSSDSSEQASKFSDTFSGSVGLDSLETAVSEAKSVSNASFSCDFAMNISGGGTYATAILSALGDNAGDLVSCCNGDTSACSTWSGSMSKAVNDNVGAFNTAIPAGINDGNDGSLKGDLSSVWPFTEGVAGITTTGPNPVPVSNLPHVPTQLDPWATEINSNDSYDTAIQNYLTVLNQIRTLQLRAHSLDDAVQQDQYNPVNVLDLTGPLKSLYNVYGASIGNLTTPGTLLSNLNTCLSGQTTSDNVATRCQPIRAVYEQPVTNAYDWYRVGPDMGQTDSWLAQQNAIAFQYSGIYSVPGSTDTLPMPVLYIDQLPPFTGYPNLEPIANQAALVGFADAPFNADNTTYTDAVVSILPLNTESDLSEVYSNDSTQGVYLTKLAKDNNIPKPGLSYGIRRDQGWDGINEAGIFIAWTAPTGCTPTFSAPCPISYAIPPNHSYASRGLAMTQILDFFTGGLGTPVQFGDVGECLSTSYDEFCAGLTGHARAECRHEQQDACHNLFGVSAHRR